MLQGLIITGSVAIFLRILATPEATLASFSKGAPSIRNSPVPQPSPAACSPYSGMMATSRPFRLCFTCAPTVAASEQVSFQGHFKTGELCPIAAIIEYRGKLLAHRL